MMNYFILAVVISLILGLIIFILSGVFVVKENMVAVFEKLYKFHSIKEKGVYFLTPFLVRRVGYYSKEIKYIKMKFADKTIYLKYKIDDFIKFHYAGHCFQETILEELKNTTFYEETILLYADKFGVKILEINIK